MRTRGAIALLSCIAAALLVTVFPFAVERLMPAEGLTRSFYSQQGFAGPPLEARTTDINLTFLEEDPSLPRQRFSVRWHGFFFVSEPQTVEFFAGGNDEVELRIDGELVVRRSLAEGTRTLGRQRALDAGSHEITIAYQQFGGGMALNIQRALQGQRPGPFLPTELFERRVEPYHIQLAAASQGARRALPYAWLVTGILLAGRFASTRFSDWRARGAPRTSRQYLQRVSMIAVPALLPPAVIFVFGPHTIFTHNAGEFSVPFRQLAAAWLFKGTALSWLTLVVIGGALALLSETAAKVYAALLFAAGLLLWGQGNLWNADYGVLAGRELDLMQHAARAPYEAAAFGIVLFAAAIAFRPISAIAPFATMAFLTVQTAAALLSSGGTASENARWIDPPAKIYQFSPNQNLVHIILDEFQSDLFTEILQQDRETLDRTFSGFRYFADHAGAFPTTSLSVPAMLTGQEYRNEKPASEFIRDSFRNHSVLSDLNRTGYEIDVVSIVPQSSLDLWLGPELSPNWTGARFHVRKPFLDQREYAESRARELVELSMFRHAPHDVKAAITATPELLTRLTLAGNGTAAAQVRRHEASNSAAFVEHYLERMSLGRQSPVYKLIHVGVPHRPIVVDRDCRFIGVTRITRSNYGDQIRCALRLVAAMLDRIRALGIYDSSLIIVSSDHGTDFTPSGFNGASDTLPLERGPAIPRLGAVAGTAKALMLIKPPRAGGALTVSNAPTSHIDLRATILALLGIAPAAPGVSMFDIAEGTARSRSFGMHDFRERFPSQYLNRLHVLAIDRRVVDAAGWNFKDTIWPPHRTLPLALVDFPDIEAQWFLGPGWSTDRRESHNNAGLVTFVHPMTKRAGLFIPSNARELVLRARASVHGAIDVTVEGSGTKRLPIEPGTYRDYSVDVSSPASIRQIKSVTLSFERVNDAGRTFKLDSLTVR